MKKYFLFDLDGTLTDTGPGIMGSVQHALNQLGWPEQEEDFLRQFVGPPLLDSFQNYGKMSLEEAEQAITLYRARYHAWGMFKSPLYPGVDGLLERLSRRAVLAVATSKREEGARAIMDMRGITPYFQAVVGDDGSRPSKAAVIAEALRLLGNPSPEEVVMVGDRSYDVAGALSCRVDCIGAGYGYGVPGELEEAGARWVVESVKQLEELCHKLLKP